MPPTDRNGSIDCLRRALGAGDWGCVDGGWPWGTAARSVGEGPWGLGDAVGVGAGHCRTLGVSRLSWRIRLGGLGWEWWKGAG